jgi:hypothetical protein
LGALSVLSGLVMLGWLASRTQRAAARAASPDDATYHLALAAGQRRMGQAFLYAGGAMLLATVGGLVGALDDRTGAFMVATTATVAAAGIILGGYLHYARHPAPRRRPAPTRKTPMPPADSLLNAPLVFEPDLSTSSTGVPEDGTDSRVAPFLAPGAIEPDVAANETPDPEINGDLAWGERALDSVATVASPVPQGGPTSDAEDGLESAAAVQTENEDELFVGSMVPITGHADLPSPPSRRDEGDDAS